MAFDAYWLLFFIFFSFFGSVFFNRNLTLTSIASWWAPTYAFVRNNKNNKQSRNDAIVARMHVKYIIGSELSKNQSLHILDSFNLTREVSQSNVGFTFGIETENRTTTTTPTKQSEFPPFSVLRPAEKPLYIPIKSVCEDCIVSE